MVMGQAAFDQTCTMPAYEARTNCFHCACVVGPVFVCIVYVTFLEVCRVPFFSMDRHFSSLLATLRYHWFDGLGQLSIERFHGETLLAAVGLVEYLNETYCVCAGSLIPFGRPTDVLGIGRVARMIPWDHDGDIFVLPAVMNKLAQLADSKVLGNAFDTSRFELEAGALRRFAGRLYDRYSGRHIDITLMHPTGDWADEVDSCAHKHVHLLSRLNDDDTETFGRCEHRHHIRSLQLCRTACAEGSCSYWQWVDPSEACYFCDTTAWVTRVSSGIKFRYANSSIAGPKVCDAAHREEPDLRSAWTVGEADCASCIRLRALYATTIPNFLARELRQPHPARRMMQIPRSWVFPVRPCPVPYWVPGRGSFQLKCPNQVEAILKYEYGQLWQKPPGLGLCGINKGEGEGAWPFVVLMFATLLMLCVSARLHRRFTWSFRNHRHVT